MHHELLKIKVLLSFLDFSGAYIFTYSLICIERMNPQTTNSRTYLFIFYIHRCMYFLASFCSLFLGGGGRGGGGGSSITTLLENLTDDAID